MNTLYKMDKKKIIDLLTARAINHWVFDLDNTLYHYSYNLFHQVEKKMTQYIMAKLSLPTEDAKILQRQYFYQHGTTLRGLMDDHGVDPIEYLEKVHDIDYDVLPSNKKLGQDLQKLRGQKYIFTNGNHGHAIKTLAQMEIPADIFCHIIDIVKICYIPKPHPLAFEHFFRHTKLAHGDRVFFVDDLADNLKTAKEVGMTTAWIKGDDHPHNPTVGDDSLPDYIDFVIDDIGAFVTMASTIK